MPNINVDVDKINNFMIPLGSTALSQLDTAISEANSVYFPSGEFGWSNLTGHLRDCYNSIRTYNAWIQNISSSMTNSIVSNLELLEGITIESVKKKN